MFSLSEISPSVKRLLFFCIVVVLLASCSIVLYYNDYFLLGDFQKLNNDDVKYVHSARTLLNNGTLVYNSGEQPSTYIMPGMPVLLAGFMLLFGQGEGGIVAFRLFQCLLLASSIYLIFTLARYAFNTLTAIIAAIISVFYLPNYFSAGEILSETTFQAILLLLIAVSILAVERKHVGWYIAVGVLVACAAYFKPHASLYPAIFLVLWIKNKYTAREMFKYLCVIGLVYCLLLSPWWIRNAVTFHKFIPFTESAGNPFLLGTFIHGNPPAEPFFEQHPQYRESLFIGSDHDAIETGKQIIRFGFQTEPLKYLYWYTLGKVVELYAFPYYWRPILGISESVMNKIQWVLAMFGLLGMIGSVRYWKRQLPILLTLGYFTLIYLPFVAFSRYGYPNIPLLFIYSAFFIERLAAAAQMIVSRRKVPISVEK